MSLLSKEGYGIPIVLAVGLHLVIGVACLVAVNFSSGARIEPKRPPIVNATVIDVSKTIIGKREEEKKKALEQAALEKEKQQAEREKAKKIEQRKALEAQKKQLAMAKAAKEKAVREAEAAKKAAEAKQKAEQEAKKAAEQALAAKKEAEQKQRLAQQQKEAEQKRKAEEEAKRIAEEKKQRQIAAAREAEKERLAQEAADRAAAQKAEEERKAAAEAQAVQSISGIITNRVAQSWIRPPSARNGMQVKLRILFLSSGKVSDVQLVSGSGNPAFDKSAINAVWNMGQIDEIAKVDSYVYERNFRSIVILFNPQDLRN